jgi:acyl-CoA synthetase (AMP-forming)/AMP-acid ligase II
VFPADIEAILGQHPDVAEAAVIGIPHAKWGESPLGLVVLRAGAHSTLADIQTWANERLAKIQRLTAIEERNAFPRNALGKVLKRELREPYWRGERG